MKREIGQDGKTVLHSEDGYIIPLIFNILARKSFKGGEYSDYAAFVAIPRMGFNTEE